MLIRRNGAKKGLICADFPLFYVEIENFWEKKIRVNLIFPKFATDTGTVYAESKHPMQDFLSISESNRAINGVFSCRYRFFFVFLQA